MNEPNDALRVLYALKMENGLRWREVATDWQLDDARAVLDPGADGPRLHWFGRPKGASKSTDLAAFSIAWLACQAVGISATAVRGT